MRPTTAAFVFLLLGFLGVAGAQAQDGPMTAPGEDHNPSLKSPGTAARLSLLTTLVPFVVGLRLTNSEGTAGKIGGTAAAAGVLFGPAVGYFYGDCRGRGISGVAIRGGLAVIGTIAAAHAEWPSLIGSEDKGNNAATIAVIAFSAVLVDMTVDLALVSGTVRRANDRRSQERVSFTPATRRSDGSTGPSIGLTVAF
jgi:hypothetical protein